MPKYTDARKERVMQHIYGLLAARQEALTGAQIYREIVGEVETADIPAPSTVYRWLAQLPDHCRTSDGKFCLSSFAPAELVSDYLTRTAGSHPHRFMEERVKRKLWLSPRTNLKTVLDWAALNGSFKWHYSPFGGFVVMTTAALAS
jgi:hypothetical protein